MTAYAVGSCLYGCDAMVAAWVAERIPQMRGRGFGPCGAIGILRNGELVGGVVFTAHDGPDIAVSGAIAPGFRASPATVRQVLSYPFGQLGCVRLSLSTGRRNKAARQFAERFGFRLEGVKRRALDGRQDVMMYGLLLSECRFLKGS